MLRSMQGVLEIIPSEPACGQESIMRQCTSKGWVDRKSSNRCGSMRDCKQEHLQRGWHSHQRVYVHCSKCSVLEASQSILGEALPLKLYMRLF